MLTDARTLAGGTARSADICIIGAGVAGVTLAQDLLQRSARVVLLESGGLTFTKSLRSLPTVLSRHLRGEQGLARGENVGQDYYPLRFTRARALGGSSRAWAGHGLQAAPLDRVDFIAREGLPHHGWPFDREALDPFYKRAQRVCNLGPFEYDVGPWERRGLGRRLPLDEAFVHSTMFQFGLDSAFNRYEAQLAGAGNVELLLHATVTRIAVDRHGRVDHVQCATLGGNRFKVRAGTFVLAAGAIESARLLLVSNDVQRRGIGNEHDLVGRYFMEHPDLEVGMLIPDPGLEPDALRLYGSQPVGPHLNANAMLRLSDDVLEKEGLLNAAIRLRPTHRSAFDPAMGSVRTLRRSLHHGVPTDGLATHAARAVRGARSLLRYGAATRAAPPDAFQLDIMAEQAPNPASRVGLGGRRDRLGLPSTVLDWRLGEHDWRSIRRTVEILGDCVRDAGIGEIVSTLDHRSPPPAVFGNWHHLGTTRMHDDPASGVVDRHCRVHGVGNLYVSGGSVMPTGGYANPTLTIAALALRLAHHLQGHSERDGGV
jgi:choline dehydrogenase-like flavoprotein